MFYVNKPTVSVILCTYNRANLLARCLDSVIGQTFQNFELIIVDDGSKDNTFEVVNPYLERFEHVRYCKHKNRTQGYARNTGIQASFGAYITFIDSDDAYHEEHLASRLEYMNAHPDIDLIEGGFATDQDIWVVDYFHRDQQINLRDCAVGGTFFGKRHVFFELEGFKNDPDFEDTDFWLRAEKQFKTAKIAAPETYLYTRAETSNSKRVFQEAGLGHNPSGI